MRLPLRGRYLIVAGLLASAVLLVGVVVLIAVAGGDQDSSSSESSGRFSSPPTSRSATVWAVGDGADGSEDAGRLAELIADDGPERFIYLGDVYPDGTAADFRSGYDAVYGKLKSITLPTPGNHDWPNHDEGYDPYWAQETGRTPPDHYGVSIAGWRILSLNSEAGLDADSAQVRWLARQVADGGSCRIAFWHRPRVSAGTHGDQPDVDSLWGLVEGRAALVLNGHDHDLQEFRPHGGTIELVVGAGGLDHYPVDESDPRLAWSTDRADGALRLRLTPGRARYDFVSPAGEVMRSGTARCRPISLAAAGPRE